ARQRTSRQRKTPASAISESRLPSGGSRRFFLAFPREHNDQSRGFFNAHRGVVDKHGIGSAHQRRNFAFTIALVTLNHFVENFRERSEEHTSELQSRSDLV